MTIDPSKSGPLFCESNHTDGASDSCLPTFVAGRPLIRSVEPELHTIMLKMLQRDRVRPDHFALGLSFLGKFPGRPDSRPARPLAWPFSTVQCRRDLFWRFTLGSASERGGPAQLGHGLGVASELAVDPG